MKPSTSAKIIKLEVESRNGILHVMNDGLKVDWLERHHIILRKVIKSYLCLHYKVSLGGLFGRVNVIEL